MYIQAEEGEEDSREGRSMHFQIKVYPYLPLQFDLHFSLHIQRCQIP